MKKFFNSKNRKLYLIGLALIVVFLLVFSIGNSFLSNNSDDSKLTTISIGLPQELPTLDITGNPSASISQVMLFNVYEGLVKVDNQGNLVPALAKTWSVSKDGKIWDFYLKKNAFFHNGKELTARNFVRMFNDNKSGDSTSTEKEFFKNMEKIESISKYHLRITLRNYRSGFLSELTRGYSVVMDESLIDSKDLRASKAIGTGKYEFIEWDKGKGITLKASKFARQKPFFSKVEFLFMPDNLLVAGLKSSKLDYVPYLSPNYARAFEKDDKFKTSFGFTHGEVLISINHKNQFLAKKGVRQALQMALDKKELMDAGSSGYGMIISSHFSPMDPNYIDLNHMYQYDEKAALEKISEYADIMPDKLRLRVPNIAYATKMAHVVTYRLSRIGVNVEAEVLDWASWIKKVYLEKDYDLSIVSHIEAMDIWNFANSNYYFQYDNKKIKHLSEKWLNERNMEKRRIILEEAQNILAEDLGAFWIYNMPKVGVYKKELIGTSPDDIVFATDVGYLEFK